MEEKEMSDLREIITDYYVLESEIKQIEKRVKKWALGLLGEAKRKVEKEWYPPHSFRSSCEGQIFFDGLNDFNAEICKQIKEG